MKLTYILLAIGGLFVVIGLVWAGLFVILLAVLANVALAIWGKK